jgi:hypothetical protein
MQLLLEERLCTLMGDGQDITHNVPRNTKLPLPSKNSAE